MKRILKFSAALFVMCACLNVKNTSDGPLSWDYVMDCTLEGFESVTWCGSVVPNMGQGINVFRSSQLDAGAEQDIWYVTSLARVSFRQKTWDNLKDKEGVCKCLVCSECGDRDCHRSG